MEFNSAEFFSIKEAIPEEKEIRRYKYFEGKGFRGHEIIPALGSCVLTYVTGYNPYGETLNEKSPSTPSYTNLLLVADVIMQEHEFETGEAISTFDRFGIIRYAGERLLHMFDYEPNDQTFSLPPGIEL